MLARLEDLAGVRRAETDFAGDLLRLSLADPAALTSAIELLTTLGYAAEPAETTSTLSWYDVRSVGELSLIEAGVIADRVLSRLRESDPLAMSKAGTLRVALVDALHTCFVTNALGVGSSSGIFHEACVRVAVAAALPVIGAALAEDVGRLLDADMRQVHRADPV